MEHYHSNLREIREKAGISQQQLANAIGVSRKTIIAMESECGSDPRISTVKRLLAYLEVGFEDLYNTCD
ncbi:putative transcriptional regulator [Pseudobutyrivibrio sp. YE44]|nr:putative transcriptional regulator [Pseudobutyrivibrio sp. YE44]